MKTKLAKKRLQGRRFTGEQKQHALTLIASGVDREKVAATVVTTTQSLRRWVEVATATGTSTGRSDAADRCQVIGVASGALSRRYASSAGTTHGAWQSRAGGTFHFECERSPENLEMLG